MRLTLFLRCTATVLLVGGGAAACSSNDATSPIPVTTLVDTCGIPITGARDPLTSDAMQGQWHATSSRFTSTVDTSAHVDQVCDQKVVMDWLIAATTITTAYQDTLDGAGFSSLPYEIRGDTIDTGPPAVPLHYLATLQGTKLVLERPTKYPFAGLADQSAQYRLILERGPSTPPLLP
jgi:hypothetical protein